LEINIQKDKKSLLFEMLFVDFRRYHPWKRPGLAESFLVSLDGVMFLVYNTDNLQERSGMR
jgi:hypothetical protein